MVSSSTQLFCHFDLYFFLLTRLSVVHVCACFTQCCSAIPFNRLGVTVYRNSMPVAYVQVVRAKERIESELKDQQEMAKKEQSRKSNAETWRMWHISFCSVCACVCMCVCVCVWEREREVLGSGKMRWTHCSRTALQCARLIDLFWGDPVWFEGKQKVQELIDAWIQDVLCDTSVPFLS